LNASLGSDRDGWGISRDAAGRHSRRRGKPAMTARLSLTFDNGPTRGITERILQVLARHGLRVTFFVIGEKLRDKAAAGLLAEMAAAGHWIGNHTLTHSIALGDRPDAAYARSEIEEAQALVVRRGWSPDLRPGTAVMKFKSH
jgi:peptidoglycan/xylan/chitin deacetylase (PgdA/CDA1 family)